jgi:hypothetical protein
MKTLFTLLICFAVAPIIGFAQTDATWDSITLSSVEHGKTVTVRADCTGTNLTLVEVVIGSETFSVPKKSLHAGSHPRMALS